MRKLVSIGVLVGATGCAYHRAVEHGDAAAARAEWQRAYDAYRFAAELRPGKVDERLAEARDEAVAAELEAARAALEAKDHATAADRVDAAERLAGTETDARVVAARDQARVALLDDLAQRMAAVEDLAEAYAFVALAKELQPHSPEVEDAAASLRQRVEADAKAQLARASYAQARETARLMARLEPEQRTRGAALERQIQDAWVAHLVAEAKAAQRARPGLAAVHFARAYEVGGDPAHAEAARVALVAAAAAAPIDVYVDSKGTGGRHWRLRKAVRAGVDAVPDVVLGWSTRFDLAATVVVPTERCHERSEKKPLEKVYKAGTRQVANPAYAEAASAASAAVTEQQRAEGEVDERRAAHVSAQEATRAATAERDRRKKVHDDAVATLDATNAQISASAQRVADAERELAALGEGDPAAIARVQQQLEEVRGFNEEWTTKEGADQVAVEAAKVALDPAEAALAAAVEVERDSAAALARAEARLAEATTKATELRTARDGTSKTLPEDVMDTARYTETTWTLACDGPATVTYAAKWTSERTRTQRVKAHVEMTDLERPAHAGAGIEVDPKAWPRPKAELLAELDAIAHQAVVAELEAWVAEHYARQLADALAATDPDAATHRIVSLAVGAPGRVDEATRGKILEHLATHHGLDDPASLLAPVPAQPAEAAEPAEG